MFQPFHRATADLEGNLEPTIHHVIPWVTKLKHHCQVLETDSSEVETLKTTCLTYIEVF